jgi:bifunctional pyridoxal-dependent enzyme with beta-cystathionase and maltose regulon repressor activities
MKWDFEETIIREGTDCIKYDLRNEVCGTGAIIPMWVADMDFRTPDFIINKLRKRLNHEVLAYSFRSSEYFDSIIRWFNFVMDFCLSRIPEIVPVHPEATYMIWLDYRKLGMSGNELQDFFVRKTGIGLNEGSTFRQGGEGFIMMNLGTTRKTVIRAMEQIEKAVSEL